MPLLAELRKCFGLRFYRDAASNEADGWVINGIRIGWTVISTKITVVLRKWKGFKNGPLSVEGTHTPYEN
jgi:hypothetical protein